MSCYDQQYSVGKEKDPLSCRSVRSQIGNSASIDWRSANAMPVRDRVSGQEYQNQKEPVVERQALYGQYGEWGWNCPVPGCCPPWQNMNPEQNQAVQPGCPAAAEPGPVPRPEPRNSTEESPNPPASDSECPIDFSNYPVGMAYVPMQQWGKTYDLDTGFSRGTIFPDLDLPFLAGRCI